jgi:hypothetical protein
MISGSFTNEYGICTQLIPQLLLLTLAILVQPLDLLIHGYLLRIHLQVQLIVLPSRMIHQQVHLIHQHLLPSTALEDVKPEDF